MHNEECNSKINSRDVGINDNNYRKDGDDDDNIY